MPAAPAPGRDGLAITALVLGILGGTILPIIFGFLGLSRIKKSGRKGRGMAVAGIVLGFVWVVVAAVVTVLVISRTHENLDRIATGPDTVGQCFDLADGASLDTATILPCDQPHRWEVYHVTSLRSGPFPGTTELASQADELCSDAAATYFDADADLDGIGITSTAPNETAWSLGGRDVLCLVGNIDGTSTTGSYAD